ncbi:MAG: hypothetical protein M1343_13835 [Chloroflexi bacterium]|nr:hypothetical protein [Chloroflexota bacterium]MDA8186924.1 hypothetical protein [Dehalococcoidales bacterium]
MSLDIQRIIAGKKAWRKTQAQLPIEEKLIILERLRDRARTLRAATKHKEDTVVDAGTTKPGTLSSNG